MTIIRGLHTATIVTTAEVLEALRDGPADFEAIAARIAVFPTAVRNVLCKAAAKGLIKRTDTVKHGRSWRGIYALTDDGRARLSAPPVSPPRWNTRRQALAPIPAEQKRGRATRTPDPCTEGPLDPMTDELISQSLQDAGGRP